jgi:hypothetical protein
MDLLKIPEKKLIKYKIIKNPINKKISISGTIGLTILKEKDTNKLVYIFYDDHSNKEYCNGTNIFVNDIYKLFEKKYKNLIFLLEEPFTLDNEKLLSLWDESTHLKKLKNFYSESIVKCSEQNVCNSVPIDIRLSLFDVSIEELVSHILDRDYYNDLDYYTPFYFKNLLYLFGIIKEKDYIELLIINDSLEEESNIDPELHSNILFLKKIFDLYSKTDYYKILYSKVYNFYIKYIKPNSNVLLYDFVKNNLELEYTFDQGYPFTTRTYTGMLDEFDHVLNGTMEFYVVILINYMKDDLIILNTGLYHALNIKFVLDKYFGYSIEYEVGITNLEQITLNVKYTNCIQVDSNFL